jgi:hypothetical protein
MLVFPQPMEITRATAISYHVVIALLGRTQETEIYVGKSARRHRSLTG